MNANRFRMLASCLSVVSYLLMVQKHTTPGIVLNLICQVLLVPFAVKQKAFDMVGLSALFSGINIHALWAAILVG
jgi:hypothetical protein